MTEDLGGGYLSGLPRDQRDELSRVNAPGLTALHEYLASGEAVAFLGAGVPAPLAAGELAWQTEGEGDE